MKKFFPQWLQILLVGFALFFILEESLRLTDNPNFFPSVLLIGAFVVPAAFIIYFYDHVRHREISMPLLTSCFLVGGALGIAAAGVIQYSTLTGGLNAFNLIGVSVIEEAAKMIFPLALYFLGRYRHEADGLLFGIAAGMGFAALETMGYGLVAFINTNGDIDVLRQVLLIRGVLSPAGHAAWTGFLAAVLWRQREKAGYPDINLKVVLAFLAVIALHTVWNLVNSLDTGTTARFAGVITGNVVVAGISLLMVFSRYRAARRSLAALTPEQRMEDITPSK